MEQYISKSAIVAEIERRLEAITNASSENNRELAAIHGAQQFELINLVQFLDTLETKEVDLELITGWFDHIAQIADDRKTLNGVIMEDWAVLDEIKCLARNSSEFVQKYYKAQKGE